MTINEAPGTTRMSEKDLEKLKSYLISVVTRELENHPRDKAARHNAGGAA